MRIFTASIGINDGTTHEKYHWLPHIQYVHTMEQSVTIKGLSIGWGIFMLAFGTTKT